jgi:hypothetical protein
MTLTSEWKKIEGSTEGAAKSRAVAALAASIALLALDTESAADAHHGRRRAVARVLPRISSRKTTVLTDSLRAQAG